MGVEGNPASAGVSMLGFGVLERDGVAGRKGGDPHSG